METIRDLNLDDRYGALQPGLVYSLRDGYTALVGPNNAGKSALLQRLFRLLFEDADFGPDRICLALPDRGYIDATSQPGGRTLNAWNQELYVQLRGAPLQFASATQGPSRSELTRVLLHGDLLAQAAALKQLLVRLGLPEFVLGPGQQIEFEQIVVAVQGSGLRGVLTIAAALTNPQVRALLIDEPELSLEPRLQKVLRDILIEASTEKVVVVSTHSHLFLNRQEIGANQRVFREGDNTTIETLSTNEELYDVVFDLLGASTEDLFFPRNYLIVEGASDQVIVEKVLELLGTPSPTIKVLAARGIDAVRDAVEAVIRALVPLIVNDSPYAKRVVALIDKVKDNTAMAVEKLRKDLGDRLFILDDESIEQYMPSDVYERAGRSKEDDLLRLTELRSDYARLRDFKKEVSDALAASLTTEDFDAIPTLVDAARRAIGH